MDVNPIKPIPVVQPPRKIERERQRRGRDREHKAPTTVEHHEDDDGSKRIDTYA